MAFSLRKDHAHGDPIDVDGIGCFKWADDERNEICGHDDGFGKAHEVLARSVGCGCSRNLTCVRHSKEFFIDDERDSEGCFVIGLVPAWESSASIGRFKLRRSDDLFDSVSVSEGRAVKAAQFVV